VTVDLESGYGDASKVVGETIALALNNGGTLYDPQLMNEVIQAVKRASIEVDTVFAGSVAGCATEHLRIPRDVPRSLVQSVPARSRRPPAAEGNLEVCRPTFACMGCI
jgi:hypothetical protein